jgi:hypothetical protein
MGLKNRDLSSSLVLDFAVFIAGFLTGILAFDVLHVSSDITTICIIVFVLGFVIGIIATEFTIVLLKRRKHPPLINVKAQIGVCAFTAFSVSSKNIGRTMDLTVKTN